MPELVVLSTHIRLCTLWCSWWVAHCALNTTSSDMKVRERFWRCFWLMATQRIQTLWTLPIYTINQSLKMKPHKVTSQRGSESPSWTPWKCADGNYIAVEISLTPSPTAEQNVLGIAQNQHIGIYHRWNGNTKVNGKTHRLLIWAEQRWTKADFRERTYVWLAIESRRPAAAQVTLPYHLLCLAFLVYSLWDSFR